MQVPNVLVVKARGFGPEMSSVLYFANEVPNLKQNRAYYLTPLTAPNQTEFRIYHIPGHRLLNDNKISFDLGNSVVTTLDEPLEAFPRQFTYLPLSLFGYQQLNAETLVRVHVPPLRNSLTTRRMA